MSWYPGAFAHDYGGTGSCYPDSVVLHEVVNDITIPADGSPSNIAGWVQSSLAVQFYVDYAGSAEQFCDSYRASSHCKDGNGHRLGIETQDDRPQTAEQSNAGSWKAPQRERLADMAAWIAATHGMPIRNMTTSRRADTGIGYHRLGVPQIAGGMDGWSDGEVWTTSPGKPCPGDGRIAQVPGIVARAAIILAAVRAGRCGFLPPGPVDLSAALARTGTTDPESWLNEMGTKEDILAAVAAQQSKVLARVTALEDRLFNRKDGSQSFRDEINWSAVNQNVPASQAVTTAAVKRESQIKVYSLCRAKESGAIYAYAPLVWFHVESGADVELGRKAGIFPATDLFETTEAVCKRLRDLCLPDDMSLYVRPVTPPVVPAP